ncbi:hypothetical protein BGW42_000213 [Actinomortierella wolfii]|nr:hypothetical protein BGW42_000213 [Actinomortierella wolfii]
MNNNHNALSATERLLKSADSLDFALTSNQDKKVPASANGQTIRQGLFDLGNFDSLFEGASGDFSTNLFDDWLSNDLQQAGFASQSDISDAELTSPASSMRSLDDAGSDSPAIGFDSIASDLARSPGYDTPMAFFPDMQTATSTPTATATAATTAASAAQAAAPAPASIGFPIATPAVATTPLLPLTPEAVQQAAAALNIPWSKGLEEAVLAQSLLASIPMALGLTPKAPVSPMTSPATVAAPVAAPSAAPRTPSTIQERDVQALTALSAAAAASRAEAASKAAALLATAANPSSASSPSVSAAPSALSSPLMAPRRSLSILSTTRTTSPSPSSTGTIQATTYKSSYRSTSLLGASRGLKRTLEYEDPPSVLEGKDISTMDEAALKRAKNTDAARRSRRKKLLKMEGLEQRVAELEVENSMFESKLNEVELERSLLADKDLKQQARIQELEKMLADVRASLLPKTC